MSTKSYSRGAVIFQEGDSGDCMYELVSGGVGIYHDYDGPNEKLIAKLYNNRELQVFGEMGLLEHAPRSATAVALEPETVLTAVGEEEFNAYFQNNPAKVLDIMQQLCSRLRRTTKDYVNACQTVHDAVEAEEKGENKSKSLLDRILALSEAYNSMRFYPFY